MDTSLPPHTITMRMAPAITPTSITCIIQALRWLPCSQTLLLHIYMPCNRIRIRSSPITTTIIPTISSGGFRTQYSIYEDLPVTSSLPVEVRTSHPLRSQTVDQSLCQPVWAIPSSAMLWISPHPCLSINGGALCSCGSSWSHYWTNPMSVVAA